MSKQEKQEYNKVQLFIQNFGTFSVIKKILYLLPVTVLFGGFSHFFDLTDFDSLLWLIPFTIPIFTSIYLFKLFWFNLILGKIDSTKTKSIISIVFVVIYVGGFHGFDEMFKLHHKNGFIGIIDLIYMGIVFLSFCYVGHLFVLSFARKPEERVKIIRRIWFNEDVFDISRSKRKKLDRKIKNLKSDLKDMEDSAPTKAERDRLRKLNKSIQTALKSGSLKI